jgi:hypothetical protein
LRGWLEKLPTKDIITYGVTDFGFLFFRGGKGILSFFGSEAKSRAALKIELNSACKGGNMGFPEPYCGSDRTWRHG